MDGKPRGPVREAEPHEPDASARGRDQVGVRAYNERLVLSLVRQNDGVARAEIARLTGLSPQTVSVIIRALESDGLLIAGEPIKGKVGQPLKPMSLAPDGAFALGLKIGRRSVDLVMMNLVGEVVAQRRETYSYPTPEPILRFVERAIREISETSPSKRVRRIAGLGVATPFFLWDWEEKVGAVPGAMQVWREIDLGAAVQAVSPYPVVMENDASAACGAELMFGRGKSRSDFLYFFVGSFIGGGLALGGALFRGAQGNAGAVGSIPTAAPKGGQLMDVTSLILLENTLRAQGVNPVEALRDDVAWDGFEPILEAWIETAAAQLARAIVASTALLDPPLVVIDGGFPEEVKLRFVGATRNALQGLDLRGLHPPEILPGLVGPNARAIGGASLPLLERFLLDHANLGRAGAS